MTQETASQRLRSSSLTSDLILPVVAKSWRFVLAATVVALLGVYGAILYYSPVYEVSCNVLFKLGRELSPPATATGTQIVAGKRPEDVASEIEIMRSQFLVEELVRHFGVDYFMAEPAPVTLFQKIKYSAKQVAKQVREGVQTVMVYAGLTKRMTPFEQIVATLQNSMMIEPVRKSDIVTIVLRTPDREGGVVLLNKFLDLYLKQHIEVYKTPRARTFFEKESTVLRDRVLTAHKGTHDFREANGVWELGEQRQLLLKQKSDLEASHMGTLASLKLLNEEIAKILDLKAGMPPEVEVSRVSERNPVIKNLDEHLGQLEANREQALAKFTPDGRVVSDLTNQINRLRAMRAREEQLVVNSVTSSRNDTLAALERSIVDKRATQQGLDAQKQEQERQLAAIEAKLALLDSSEVEVERQNREIALLNKNFQLYAEKLEDARISEAMDLANISNVTVVAPPTASVLPVWPNKRVWFLAALALGIGGSLGIAFARELVQPTARSRTEIAEVVGAPVLATIAETRRKRPSTSLGMARAAGSGLGSLGL